MKKNYFLTVALFLLAALFSVQAKELTQFGILTGVQLADEETNEPTVSVTQKRFDVGEEIQISYAHVPEGKKVWVGIYRKYQNVTNAASVKWEYTTGASGTVTFSTADSNEYYAALYLEADDGTNTELSKYAPFLVGSEAKITIDKSQYKVNQPIVVTFATAPALEGDWLGIYRDDITPGADGTTAASWAYVPQGTPNGTLNLCTGEGSATFLPVGRYFIAYFLRGGYFEPFERIYFDVKEETTAITSPNGATSDAVATLGYDAARGFVCLTATQDGTFTLFGVDGSKLMNKNLEAGSHEVSVNEISQRLVIAMWKGVTGQRIVRKIHLINR